MKIMDLKNSVNSKKSYGGTSFENIKKMIKKYKKKMFKKIIIILFLLIPIFSCGKKVILFIMIKNQG